MRSNKFISMLAVAAVMVGCSQEELPVAGSQQLENNLANRPVVGNVEIGLGVESRMALKDGSALNIAYELGDKVGAALIDVAKTTSVVGKTVGSTDYSSYSWTYDQYLVNTNHGTSQNPVYYTTAGLKAKDFYTTVEYISSNYPYTRNEDGVFESEANLLEGNYMFYMPYNASHLNRKAINAVLPQVQDCSDDVMRETTWKSSTKIQASSTALSKFYAGTMEGFEGAPVVVGYKFLEAPKDGSLISPSVEMNHLYAYPMITVKNDFNGFFYGYKTEGEMQATSKSRATATMTVDSVQVYYEGSSANPLFYKAPFSSEKIASTLAEDEVWEYEKLHTGAPTADILGTAVVYDKHANVDVTKAGATGVVAATNRVTMVIGKELAPGASYSFHGILPAGNYGKDLKALVYVTINGTRYVIVNAVNTVNYTTGSNPTITKVVASDVTEKAFGSERYANVELMRGEHFPKAEINVAEDGTKTRKAFAGEGLTISMATVYNSTAKTYTGGTAFELVKEEQKDDNGIISNEDMIDWLNNYVGRGEAISETADKEDVRDEWAANAFAIAKVNTLVIDAQLIKDLKKQTVDDADLELPVQDTKLTLTTNLPIANDVKITDITPDGLNTIYTFQTLDEDKVSYHIRYSGATYNTTPTTLKSGINLISDTGVKELKPYNSATNIVVVLTGHAKYTANSTGISTIFVDGGTLDVNAECDVQVSSNGTINVGENGSLTNDANVLSGTIVNNYLNEVAGTLADGTVVEATATGWPNAVIPANAKVNSYIIAPAIEVPALATAQADINKFANLSKVTITLNANVKGLTSAANITLTNIKSVSALYTSGIKWSTTSVNGITVSGTKYDGSNYTTKSGITKDTGVTFSHF